MVEKKLIYNKNLKITEIAVKNVRIVGKKWIRKYVSQFQASTAHYY